MNINLSRHKITDAEYFDGFLMHDDVLIRKFMNDCRKAFYSSICKVRGNKSDEFLDEALVITIERLWEKINNQRIELGNLTVSLKDYMIGIGKHVAEELERKYNPSHSTISDMVYFFCPKCGYWEDYELEKYKRQGIKVPICSECKAQMIRHVEREIRDYEITLLSSSKRESTNSDNGFDDEAENIGLRSTPTHHIPLKMEQDAQLKMMWEAIDKALELMTEKCEKILRMRYIEHKSYEDIIALMNYSTTDSAKTQKNKCMPKIKEKAIQIYNQLRNQ
jgi:hypothetical protein